MGQNDFYMYSIISVMFLSEFELAPDIVITLLFYLNILSLAALSIVRWNQ